MRRRIRVVAAVCVATLTVGATAQQPSSPAADGALATVQAFVAALSNADLEGLLNTFEENATVFMPIVDAPSRLAGKAAIRSGFRPFLDRVRQSGKGPQYMTLTPHDITVQSLDANTSVVTFHLGPPPPEPITRPVTFSRRTFVLKRTDSGWWIVHLHASNVVIEPTGSNEGKRP
jgi:ketosteroid isomerase-like protein